MIVITGSESFVGAELKAQLINAGHDYVGLDALPSADSRTVVADICSPTVADVIPEKADALIHLAAISRDKDCLADPVRAFTVNVNGTINLIRAAQARGVRQFIFASSEWVYGNVPNDQIQTEDLAIDIRKLHSEYAITKLIGEQMLRIACERTAWAATVLRFGIIYGKRPANWSAVEQLFFAARDKETIEVGSARTARRFIHVSDICRGILASLGRSGYEIFNLSGDSLISLRDIVETGAKIWGTCPTLLEKNPDGISLRDPRNAKAQAELRWAPQLDLASGLRSLT
jgi:nucleoside-diphosphate-sugar epimerase